MAESNIQVSPPDYERPETDIKVCCGLKEIKKTFKNAVLSVF